MPSRYSSDNIDAMVCSVNKLSVSPSQNLIAVPYDNRNVSSRVAKWQIDTAVMLMNLRTCPVAWKNTFWSKNECKTSNSCKNCALCIITE